MSEDTRHVLDLLAQGKITVDEAHELIGALGKPPAGDRAGATQGDDPPKPRYLRINVHKAARDGRRDKDVSIRVPMSIVRSGVRLGTIIPGFARQQMSAKLREQGVDIDLARIDPAKIEALLKDLGEVHIDVNGGEEQVRISCE